MPTTHDGLRHWTAPLIVAVIFAAVAGCSSRNNPEQAVLRFGDSMSDLFKGNRHAPSETVRIDVEVPLAVDVEVFHGDVIVRANPNVSKATVVVRRESTHGVFRSVEGRRTLDGITASAALVSGDLGPALRVRAVSDDPESHYQRAHVWIEAPSIEDVRVRTGFGRVEVRQADGRVDIEARRGHVLFATPAAIAQAVTMVSNDGDVDFRAGPGSTGEFDLESVGGRVRQRTTAGRWIATDSSNRHNRVRARLDDGRNRVVLRAVDGDVRVAIVEDPMAFGLKIVDP